MNNKPKGRPSNYSQDIANLICERISNGESLRSICKSEDMPQRSTVFNWLANEKYKDFLDRYARAREEQAENLAEEIFEIADDGSNDYMTITKGNVRYNVEDKEVTSRSKLRVDARKWYLSKVLPKKYGDKLDLNHSGSMTTKVIHDDIE
jgi:hypothetical protein